MDAPDMHCDPNARCMLIDETGNFECECRQGYNGTGKVCTGLFECCYNFTLY